MAFLINFLFVPVYYYILNSIISNKKRARLFFFSLVSFHAILFRALANPYVYDDSFRYAYAFEQICGLNLKDIVLSVNAYTEWGIGYLVINWIITQFTHNAQYLFIVVAILTVGGTIRYYYKSTYTPLLTILLYLSYPMMYTMSFGVIRQHLSIMFALWALFYLDKLKYSIPLILFGILCHTSTLVFLPFYFISHFNLKKINSFKLFCFSALGFLATTILTGYLLKFFLRYEDIMDKESSQTNIVPVFMIGITIFILYIGDVFRKIKEKRDENVVRFILYGFVIALFGLTVPAAGRLSLCFIYVMPVALSFVYKYNSSRTISIIGTIVISLTVLLLDYYSFEKFNTYLYFWEKVI